MRKGANLQQPLTRENGRGDAQALQSARRTGNSPQKYSMRMMTDLVKGSEVTAC